MLEKLLVENPHDGSIHDKLGKTYLESGSVVDKRRAVEHLEKAL